ncbi:DUF1090 domain-containing protein [Pseudomonas putida]|uniref:DUF1090 domain-containing protein n=1 Tax=Pseudomonas putida TaxID=303 RepID=A0A7W2QGY1_PSEPU|nr:MULTISPECIES: DUF1090 domain-containing protein [Pseudomonas]MBA6114220.1 DUF1090 domain-containing protein [Pseudomonas putida]MBI6940830.1 DUF1090 domain-containing protein [Pseudomonas putida]MBI6957028.1 DUF1090 domain-containing protein [Pseudomonas putida]MCZ9640004.1 DUF1090 domain-containing protein [Pseudomonas putida]MEC4875436.1 DUF1090 domain-containing protein [Pseudomonas sp. NC26]
MKLLSYFALLAIFSVSATAGAAQPTPGLTGCAAKRSAIEHQLEYAKAHNNAGQISGLERALKENKEHCTDEGLKQEREQKVRKAEAEVQEREADLKEAQAKGDQSKIAKREKKLAEAKAELEHAKAELTQ